MAFFEEVFPTRISKDAVGGPRFLTSKAYSSSGQRITNRDAAMPLHEYTIAHPPRTQEDFEELRAFFYVVGGDADEFRFKDLNDYIATHKNTTLTAVPGAANTWQLCRTYSFGSRMFVRPIYKTVSGSKVQRARGSNLTTLSAAPEPNTGRVVITDHVAGDVYTWRGEFHVPVAFKDPAAMWHILGGPWIINQWDGIELEEVRLKI